MWVIKIGGSLQHAGNLPEFLAMLVEHAAGQAVIVPGGGDFADQVRQLQAEMNLDDMTAHHMALRAMEKYGAFLTSCDPGLQPARSFNEISQLLARRKIPVWFPYDIVADNPSIPACWDVSSDTLSLWFAEQLRCRYLFILKSIAPETENYSAWYLSQHGFLDKGFIDMTKRTHVVSWWLHYQQATSFFHMLYLREHPATVLKQITTYNQYATINHA
jgi:hypothetical protein